MKFKNEMDYHILTPSDYAVMVKGLTNSINYKQLKE